MMIRQTQSFQRLQRIHRWVGLFLSLHIMVLALSGVVLVFYDELVPKSAPKAISAHPVSLQTLVDKSLQHYPGDRLLAIGVDHDDPQKVSLRLGPDGSPKFRGARRVHYDRRDGSLLPEPPRSSGFWENILLLHRELFLGSAGKLYVGVLGLLYALLLISGLLIYGPFMKRMHFGTIRQLHPRLLWADLHKSFGVMTFAWSLVIGLTGFLLGWGGPIIKYYQSTALGALTQQYAASPSSGPAISVDAALQAAVTAQPDGQFSFVSFPGSEFSTAQHYIFVLDGTTPLTQKLSDLVLVDAHDGSVAKVLVQPWYLQLLLLAEPLHFGDYGGLPMKILWAMFGLFSLVLPLSGLRIFWQRLVPKIARRRPGAAGVVSAGTKASWPYRLPLILMLFCWLGLGAALLVEGPGDAGANLVLAAVLLLPLWLLWRRRYASSPK